MRATVRGRLTLLYGGLFLASGAALLALTYMLVEKTFPVQISDTPGTGGRQISGTVPGGPPMRPADTQALVAQLRTDDLHHLLADSSIALAVMVLVSLALGWLVAGRVLRPLRVITATTRQISEDNLHQRLAMTGPPDELHDLGDTIDDLLTRLDTAFDSQRRFVANASHELRTPLTVGRTLLEMVLTDPDATIASFRVVCRDVLEAHQQQERLIDALLTLARSQRGLHDRRSVDLATIATSVARGFGVEATAIPTVIEGDAALVERLVCNLVDNAVRYNYPGGTVRVLVDRPARLRVSNTGPRVPAEDLHRLLEPFQRDRAAKPDGLGLGLSIVAAIATAHGARLTIHAPDTGGLDVEIAFQPCRTS